ncbi:uncharacterized protein [Centruroides vittatus]|uniref:uncharacterized protein n=1 Tax=Centruroides vittatus TaxID=120091 RepID=UPI00350EE9D5
MAEKFNKTAINFSYVEKLDILIQSFQDRFSDFKKVKPLLDIFSNPFTISVENAPESMQLEIIDIQNDQDLRNKFNEGDLLNFYRCIDKNIFDELLSKIGPLITCKNTTYRKSISPAEQLALTLRFLAHGGEQQICALNYRIGVSTTHNIVKRVCNAIWTVLSSEYLKIPDKKTFIEISKKFNVYCNFPQCLGAIDGKHVVIQQPKHSGTVYHNYKGTNSIILMAACDAEYRFTIVDIGAPGICSDGGVFSNSVFGKLIEQKKLDLPADEKLAGTDIKVPHCFVGMRPFFSFQIYYVLTLVRIYHLDGQSSIIVCLVQDALSKIHLGY